MFNPFDIVSGILSFIAIIVFFVVAHHISQLLAETRKTNKILMKQAEKEGLTLQAKCAACGKSFPILDKSPAICPHCSRVNNFS